MKVSISDIGGEVVKDNLTYLLKDNTSLKNLVLSSTRLCANKSTTGHRHAGQEEVYVFVKGTGQMELDHKIFDVAEGDEVQEGQTLCTVEAMKMENILRAERKGVVKKINVDAGDSLAVDEVIMEFE